MIETIVIVGVTVLMSAAGAIAVHYAAKRDGKLIADSLSYLEGETFKLGLEVVKAQKERDEAVEALHMLAAEVRKNRPIHVARTVALPDLEKEARRMDIEAAIKEELGE